MVITDSIRKAIQAAIAKSGSSLSFSRSIGVSHTTVSYWLNGRTRKINANLWQIMLPLISEFLTPSETMPYSYDSVAAGNGRGVLRERSWGAGGGQAASVPMLRFADLEDFDSQIDSIEELVREKAKTSAVFTSPIIPGSFAVGIDKERSGFFHEGTRLLLRWLDAPGDGDTVLVKLREKNEFLFAVYSRKGGDVVLTPLLSSGRKRTIRKGEFHNVCAWIVSIREAIQLF